MPTWALWLDMARESEKAGRVTEAEGLYRVSVSRYYYAAYQAATAVLLYRRQTPPDGRGAWSHAETPQLFREHLGVAVASSDSRKQIADNLRKLYKARVDADYVSDAAIDDAAALGSRKLSVFLVKVVENIVDGGRK